MTFASLAALAGTLLFPGAMLYAGLRDLMTMKIRNPLVAAVALSYFVLAPLAGLGPAEIGAAVAVAALVFALTFVFFWRGWIGGGDAKLAAATALWFGPELALAYFTYTALLGGLLTLLILQFRAWPLPATLHRVPWLVELHAPRAGIPYGAAMAPAALIVFPDTFWVAAAVGG